MSLSVTGVWEVGVWDQTVWADGVWREGAYEQTDTDKGPGGPPGRKKFDRDEYERAFYSELERQREALQDAVALEMRGNTLKRKPRKRIAEKAKQAHISVPELEQLASIEDEISRNLAIEFEIRRLFKQREDEALAILLLIA